ncbi:MAG: CynX/NimT family MFS transporter [Alphaproteobacteria bacterium]
MSPERKAPPAHGTSATRPFVALILLWLCGAGSRMTLLAVPPVIPLLHADLKLSESAIGVLSGLPSFLFALAAVPASLLIARVGALTTLVAGLLLTAAASALRGAAGDTAMLFAMTFLMGLGIAAMQPALPPIVRDWLPYRIGFGTAIYSNGLLVGEILAAALTIPWVLPLLGGSWRLSFVFWSVPVLVTAVLLAVLAPRAQPGSAASVLARRRWWPEWRGARIWRLGLTMGGINSIYFASNAFLPDYLHATGHPELVNAALTALNLGQLPASFILLALADRLVGRAWPLRGAGLLSLAATLAIILMPGASIVLWAAVLGFSAASGLILTLALPALISAPDDVHRTSAGMFTISYACPVVVSVAAGWLWDKTALAPLAFLPIGLCAVAVLCLAPSLALTRKKTAERT